jgi:hypothetical protein
MKTENTPNTPGALVDVAVLDVFQTPGLLEELVSAYRARKGQAATFSDQTAQLLRFRTECRWGRVSLGEHTVFMFNELGTGPKQPLSQDNVCRVSIFAELPPGPHGVGFYDTEPFIDVAFNADQARSVPTLGLVKLEEFILRRLEGVERAYLEWRRILEQEMNRILARRAASSAARSGHAIERSALAVEERALVPQAAR